MNRNSSKQLVRVATRATLALAMAILAGAGAAWAVPQYLNDGALQNSYGGFDLPTQGSCWGDGAYNPAMKTRALCTALRLNYANQAACIAGVAPEVRSWSTGVCNDNVNTTLSLCNAQPDRLWNASTSKCAIVMSDDDRNDITCLLHGGTWVTSGACTGSWIMPYGETYTPNLLTGMPSSYLSPPGPGDQCLRCHNTRTQYNGPRVRDTEDTLFMGHKNMSRKVTPTVPWGGPPFNCIGAAGDAEEECYDNGGNWVPVAPYPGTDTGQDFDWVNGKVNVNGSWKTMTWIYGDWLSALPRAVYLTSASSGKVCTDPRYLTQGDCLAHSESWVNNAGASYSCARCHTTGWTSDSTIAPAFAGIENKEPENSFPGITWSRTGNAPANVVNLSSGVLNDANKYASWDNFGITCTRCHNSAIETTSGICSLSCSNQADCERPTNASTSPTAPFPGCGGFWDAGDARCETNQFSNVPLPNSDFTALASVCSAVGGSLGTGQRYAAAAGMSTHHNNLTAPDNSGGVCSDPKWTREAECTGSGATWLTACSLPSTTATCVVPAVLDDPSPFPCEAAGGVWNDTPDFCDNPFYNGSQSTCISAAVGGKWQTGWCERPDLATQTACVPNQIIYLSYLARSGGGSGIAVTTQPVVGTLLHVGDFVTIAGVTSGNSSTFNKTFQITAIDGTNPTTTFYFVLAGGPDTATSTGSITATLSRAWRTNGSQASCQLDGGTWQFSSCTVAGLCDKGVNVTDPAVCAGIAGAKFRFATDVVRCDDIHVFGKENNIPAYEAAHWTGTNNQRGQLITGLCMNCHRQETQGIPYDNTTANPGSPSTTEPGNYLKVGPAHGTVDFVSHPHGNQFLNSPHGKFTGKFDKIGTGKFNYSMTGDYKSFFMTEGEASNTGNGCTGCHDVHQSTVTGEKPFAEECTECHAKNLSVMHHPPGKGTPLEEMGVDPMEACVTCHMPGGKHLFRINDDPTYSTMPAAALTGVVNANTAADGNMAKAVWVDIDAACGQCHGGGTNQAETSGRIDLKFWNEDPIGSNTSCADVGGTTWDAGAKKCYVTAVDANDCAAKFGTWTAADPPYIPSSLCALSVNKYVRVASNAGLAVGQRIKIEGAGSLYYDDDGVSKLNDDLETYIGAVPVSPTGWVTLAGTATKNVLSAPVTQNPTRNGAGYMTKAQLATLAKDIHNDAPVANFTYTLGNPNTKQVTFSAAASSCGGSPANCDVFDWDFGDGSNGTGMTPTHTYTLAGTYAVTLTVEQYGVGSGTKTKNVTTYNADLPPTIAASCVFNSNTWLFTVTDTGSTDDHAITQGVVDWGDGSLLSKDVAPPLGPFTHTYSNAGNFLVTYKISDSVGQVASTTCIAAPSTFKINGQVRKVDGVTPVGGVTIKFLNGATVVKTVYSDVAGNYLAGNLKPANYTLLVSKSGWSFPSPAVNVGPDKTQNINALVDGASSVPARGKDKTTKPVSQGRPASGNR